MRNCDTDFLNALNAMDTPEQPLTPGELDRLAAGVLPASTRPAPPQPKHLPPRQPGQRPAGSAAAQPPLRQ